MEYLYGAQPVLAALRASHRRISQLLLYETGKIANLHVQEALRMAQERNIKIHYATRTQLDELCENRPHQNMALQVRPLRIPFISKPHVDAILSLLLVNITDPQNIGSILRSAFYFGVKRVYLTSECSPPSPIVSKASGGSLETFADRLAYCAKGSAFITAANSIGWDTIATGSGVQESSQELSTIIKPTLLVMGNEGFGLPKTLQDSCTRNITIKGSLDALSAGLDSLNVGVAAAIIMSKLYQK